MADATATAAASDEGGDRAIDLAGSTAEIEVHNTARPLIERPLEHLLAPCLCTQVLKGSSGGNELGSAESCEVRRLDANPHLWRGRPSADFGS